MIERSFNKSPEKKGGRNGCVLDEAWQSSASASFFVLRISIERSVVLHRGRRSAAVRNGGHPAIDGMRPESRKFTQEKGDDA